MRIVKFLNAQFAMFKRDNVRKIYMHVAEDWMVFDARKYCGLAAVLMFNELVSNV